MTYRGHVEDGKIILDEGAGLPEGTEVRVRPVTTSKATDPPSRSKRKPTVGKGLLALSGSAKGLPRDASRNLDHYLYGHRKR